MQEQFNDLPENWFEGYKVSNYGRIFNTRSNRIIQQYTAKNGYQFVCLYQNNIKVKVIYIHRLVAYAFIPNPEHLPQIDHIDGNQSNNMAWNLQWVTARGNCSNPIRKKRLGKQVSQLTLEGQLIQVFDTLQEAADATGISRTCISNCCRHNQHTAGGFLWKYVE